MKMEYFFQVSYVNKDVSIFTYLRFCFLYRISYDIASMLTVVIF